MENLITSRNNKKESKSTLLNNIVEDLMAECDSIEAVIIADWQGLSFASKLPKDVNEDEISATTLFTLEGAEGTRKELEKSLLGNKLTYLLMCTEKKDKSAFMFVFPIGKLGYIASISCSREDMALIVQNMKLAANKATQILSVPEKVIQKEESVEPVIAEKYKKLMQKLDALKSVKLSFLDSECTPSTPQQVPASANPLLIPEVEAPSVSGPLTPPQIPLEFVEVEAEIDSLEPEIIFPDHFSKYQVVFLDAKKIKYTVNVDAEDEFDAEVRLKGMGQYYPIEIISITQIEP